MLRKLAILGLAAYGARKLIDKAAASGSLGETVPTALPGPRATLTDNSAASPSIGHAPTDLSGETHPDGSQRADDHFRPDPHASIPPEDLEGLRPVTVPPARQPVGI